MAGDSRRRQQQRRRRSPAAKAADLWRPVPPLDEPEPITPAADPTAVLRSIGEPPLHGHGVIAEHYLAAVLEQASSLATALAAAADLLADDGDDEHDEAGAAEPDLVPQG